MRHLRRPSVGATLASTIPCCVLSCRQRSPLADKAGRLLHLVDPWGRVANLPVVPLLILNGDQLLQGKRFMVQVLYLGLAQTQRMFWRVLTVKSLVHRLLPVGAELSVHSSVPAWDGHIRA